MLRGPVLGLATSEAKFTARLFVGQARLVLQQVLSKSEVQRY